MEEIRGEDVRGVFIVGGHGKVLCKKCVEPPLSAYYGTEVNWFITEKEIQKADKPYFCDKCGKQL